MEGAPKVAATQRLAYRPLVPAAAAFACGIALREFLDLPAAAAWGACAAAVVGYPVCRWARLRRGALAWLYVLVVCAGWVRLDMATERRPPHHVARCLADGPALVKLRGEVAGEVELRVLPPMPLAGTSRWLADEAYVRRFDLACREARVDGAWVPVCGRVRVVEHLDGGAGRAPYGYGDTVVVTGTARLPEPPSNPGQLDVATLLRRRGIAATMSVGEGAVLAEGRRRVGWRGLAVGAAYSARASLRSALQTTLAPSREAAGLLCALVLGDRTGVGKDLQEAFARTGTIHLLAVSGFNVGIVAWLVWAAASALGLGRRASAGAVLGGVAGYAMLTGAPPSVMRAALMTGAVVLSILGRRAVDLLQAVAIAALVLLAARPFDLFQAGFQLSFVAVLGIVCLMGDFAPALRPSPTLLERLQRGLPQPWWARARRGFQRAAANAAGVSAAAWLAVMPLTAYYFHHFSPITVLANLAAVPIVAVLTVLGFAHAAVAGLLPAAGWVLAWPARGCAGLLAEVVRGAERVPFGWAYCASPALGWVVGYYVLGLVVVGRRRLGLSGRRALMLWLAGILAYLVAGAGGGAPSGFEATALDVRDGNATVLRFPDGSTVVYDCGSYGRSDVGRWVAAPALWHWGVRRIDLLVVTHADADHVNGIPALLERFRVGQVVHSPILDRAEAGRQLIAMLDGRGIPRRAAMAGDRFEVGEGNVLEVLWPSDWSLRLHPRDQNENSLVLRVERGGRHVLLCADIQQVAATALLHGGADLRADALVVPHHGRLMANSAAFARAVRPRVAVCSNKGDHLPAATVAAYEAVGARVMATCWDGAVTVRFRDGAVEASGWRRGGTRGGAGGVGPPPAGDGRAAPLVPGGGLRWDANSVYYPLVGAQ